MGRMKFDSTGKLVSVDNERGVNLEHFPSVEERKPIIENIADKINDSQYWSLYKNGKSLEPLKFSNGKSQEDIVKEVIELIKGGNKIIFLHGMCGTGKSAIALNIARVLGKASIVVPVKNLQKQYEQDYMGSMNVYKTNQQKLKIAMITGRENHDSVFVEGVNCADPFLPDTIQINEKNYDKIKEYYGLNPLVKSKTIENIKDLKRISIAPANPYWSPIITADYELHLKDATKKRYVGLNNKDFIFYHRKKGCSYYDQYQAYIDADIIIFNSAKYKIEVALDRKPQTEVDIIDEADEFLDSFSNQIELNLTRLGNSLKHLIVEDESVRELIDNIVELVKLEERNKGALGIDENKVFHISETQIEKILDVFAKHRELEAEIVVDEANYANRAVEASRHFADFLGDTYVTFRKFEENLYANLVTTNLSKNIAEILNKNKSFVFMSGTLHSEKVLKNIFGIENYKTVEAEVLHQGEVDILRTGKEFDCSYKNFSSKKYTREDYLKALSLCVEKAEKPMLVQVNAFEDLPSSIEIGKYGIYGLMAREELLREQNEDRNGETILRFKKKTTNKLYSTKCTRGVDFPGDICKSVVFTKYPNPNVQGSFWKILEKTHPKYFWDFYKDKARREFLQRLYRALRSKDDHVFVLSPDMRVLDAVRELQLIKIKS
ncbi:MAG: helicase C-terminal domain-containing protein [Nanoarchaeota archaeon]|nr:helicase C-terminal domain-containing protein [Nanoarchaeota archaeon]